MNVVDIINELDKLRISFRYKCIELKNKLSYQDKDVRLSYYYLSYQNIDSAIDLLMFSDEALESPDKLSSFYKTYDIESKLDNPDFDPNADYIQTRNNLLQFIANQYSFSIFSLFEHSFRTIIRHSYPSDYAKMEDSFFNMFSFFVKQFKNNSQYFANLDPPFIGFFNAIRNSIHNNGLFLPNNKKNGYTKTLKDLDGNQIIFEYGKLIPSQKVWRSHIQMTEKFSTIYSELIEIHKIKKEPFIEDPSVL